MSAFSAACRVFSTRAVPMAPSSSKPAVSIKTTGPTPGSSMALYTGSAVVPATGDTSAASCPVSAFTSDDFPALRRPNSPM